MIKNITNAYVVLLAIFGVILTIGSVKSTIYPDETVYVPGKVIALYNPQTEQFLNVSSADKKDFNFDTKTLSANIFDSNVPTKTNNNCE